VRVLLGESFPKRIASNQLTFGNAAVDAGVSPAPKGYRAAWSGFDNNTGQATAIATTEGATSPLAVPNLPATGFVKVEITASGGPESWTKPVSVYFRKKGGDWTLIGLERLPEKWTGEPANGR
jgi:hypothetical protein